MWASVQTVRGCPKHCSFCSVWRTDGQKPRQRGVDAVVGEIVELRRRGFRFILLADDNFYPVTKADLEMAARRADPAHARRADGDSPRALRADGAALAAAVRSGVLHADHDGGGRGRRVPRRDARARIRGALVGVESVTPEGLKSVYKDFNMAGDALVRRLQAFREHGVHILGSFIFGLPTDTPDTFAATADVAQRSGVSFAQFVMLTPFPGTLDFAKWEKESRRTSRPSMASRSRATGLSRLPGGRRSTHRTPT